MTIPASDVVSVNPGVIGSGGNPLALNGVIMSKNTYLAIGSVPSFSGPDAVGAYFGAASTEYALAQIYFTGFDNSPVKPGTLFFAPFADVARAAWLQSGSLSGMTLAQLQAITAGIMTVTMNGVLKTSTSINLATAVSFSDAATKIAAAFTSGPAVAWDAVRSTFIMTSSTTGAASVMTFAAGAIADALKLSATTGATLSQGSDIMTPGVAMDAVKSKTQNWVDFMTVWEPAIADKTLFAAWNNAQNQRFSYVCWDSDAQAIVNGTTTAFGVIAKGLAYDGIVCVSGDAAAAVAQGTTLAVLLPKLAAFALGSVASIDFSRTNGRITAAFKSQSGFTPTVLDQQIAANLLANGYSFYGAYATANDQFNFFYNGQMTGKWKWLDTFVNQVKLNSQFQLALLSLLTSVPSIPYNDAGYALIRAAMIDPIQQGLNFGSIRAGVTLSASQKAQVNSAAGQTVDNLITQNGYYLQILDPGAQVRGNRGTPVINFWYSDGGAVQKISLASIDIM